MIQGVVVDTNKQSISFYRDLCGFITGERDIQRVIKQSDPYPSPYYFVTPIGDVFHIEDKGSQIAYLAKHKKLTLDHLSRKIAINEQLLFDNSNIPSVIKIPLIQAIADLRTDYEYISLLKEVPSKPFAASVFIRIDKEPTESEIIEFKQRVEEFSRVSNLFFGVHGYRFIVFNDDGTIVEKNI